MVTIIVCERSFGVKKYRWLFSNWHNIINVAVPESGWVHMDRSYSQANLLIVMNSASWQNVHIHATLEIGHWKRGGYVRCGSFLVVHEAKCARYVSVSRIDLHRKYCGVANKFAALQLTPKLITTLHLLVERSSTVRFLVKNFNGYSTRL